MKGSDLISKRVNLTLRDEKYDVWKKEADKRQVTLPDFIRRAVDVYITIVHKRDQKG